MYNGMRCMSFYILTMCHDYTLQVPLSCCRYRSFICKYLLPHLQVPWSTRQQANLDTVLFTLDLLTPHTAFLRLHATVPAFWNVSTHFLTPVHSNPMSCARDAATIVENWSLTERRFRHLERTVLGRYLLSCHTVISVHTFLSFGIRNKFSFMNWTQGGNFQ